jgi:hypothetical protein
MKLKFYLTKRYETQGPLRTPGKQTQSIPTCSELACGEQGRTVEPISPLTRFFVDPRSLSDKLQLQFFFQASMENGEKAE